MNIPYCSTSYCQAIGCDDLNSDYDPFANYCNFMTELDDFNAEDLFDDIDDRDPCSGSPTDPCSGSPTPLMRADEFAPGDLCVSTISNGSNDDVSCSAERDLNTPFPILLYSIVSDEATDHAIHWLPCGKRFVVSDKEEFSQNVLPIYFGGRGTGPNPTTKFTSFTRRLKRWNFSRVPSGRELGAYYHEYFQKDHPELVKKIVYPMGKQASPKARSKSGSPKVNRRASTGSTPLSLSMPKMDISPAPIKKMFGDDSADDIKKWLSNTDIEFEGMASPLPIDDKRRSGNSYSDFHVVSSEFSDPAFPPLLPSLLPISTISGRLSPQDDTPFTGLNVGSQMRRHSYLDPLPMKRMRNPRNASITSYCDAYPNPESNHSRTPEVTMNHKTMRLSPNDVLSAGETLNALPSLQCKNCSIDDEDDYFQSIFAREVSCDGIAPDTCASWSRN